MKQKMIRLDLERMQARCFASTQQFKREPGFEIFSSKKGVHLFKDNGASILAVAHLDTVQSSHHYYELMVGGQRWVLNPQLDDRLGVYVLLDYLPQYGLKYDILLTEGEESGQSTAGDFRPPEGKQYNWMFQFDRTGEDVVSYDYRCKELDEHLERHGFKTAIGSFSDICKLEDLGCKGFNVGCGYENYHSLWAIANLGVLKRQVLRFISFYWEMHTIHLPHTKKVWSGFQHGSYEWGEWDISTKQYKYNHRHRGKRYKWEQGKMVETGESGNGEESAEVKEPTEAKEPTEKEGMSAGHDHDGYVCQGCYQPSSQLKYHDGLWYCTTCMEIINVWDDGKLHRTGTCNACLQAAQHLECYRGSWYCEECMKWAREICEKKGDTIPPET